MVQLISKSSNGKKCQIVIRGKGTSITAHCIKIAGGNLYRTKWGDIVNIKKGVVL